MRQASAAQLLKYSIHGMVATLENQVPWLQSSVDQALGIFQVSDWPEGFVPTEGHLYPFDRSQVMRHISPSAKALPRPEQFIEVYQDGDNYWVVDDRWGMAHLNPARGSWRSWILPHPVIDPLQCVEWAVTWPLAQLLPCRGLFLLPAIAAVRDRQAILILCPHPIEAELRALVGAGWRIIAQRWTALREEEGKILLLNMPGMMECLPSRRNSASAPSAFQPWVDVTGGNPANQALHAFCDTVLIVDSGIRGSDVALRPLGISGAVNSLRRSWPIVELQPLRGYGQLPVKLAQKCRVCDLQLSGDPVGLVRALGLDELTCRLPKVTLNAKAIRSFSASQESRQAAGV